MGVKIKDTVTPEGKRFQKLLKELASKQVRTGFQAGKKEKNGADICDVAAFNEFGTVDIPSRPFIRNSVDNHEEEITSFVQREIAKCIRGGQSAESALKRIGVFQKSLIQREITEGSFVPNAPSTIRKKKSSKPLIDTGRMRQSVNYEIKPKGGL